MLFDTIKAQTGNLVFRRVFSAFIYRTRVTHNIPFAEPAALFVNSPTCVYAISSGLTCSVVVDFLFIVTPIVGACNCSMFCCTLLYVHSSIAIVLMG